MMGDDVHLVDYTIELQAFAIAEAFQISPMEVLQWDYSYFVLAQEWLHHRAYAQKHGGNMNGRSKITSSFGNLD